MKKTIIVFAIVISTFFSSCSDKCVEDNQPIPASFFVEIVNETTNENVFENETYVATDIAVTDVLNNEIVFKFVEGDNVIQLLPRTTIDANNIQIKIVLDNQTTMESDEILIRYNVISTKEECYTSFSFTNVLFPNNISQIDEKGIYQVKI